MGIGNGKQMWNDAGLLIIRVIFGIGMATHGYGKVFGNIDRLIEGVRGLGFPMATAFAWAAALSEFAGGILLALGFFTRPAAFFIVCTMAVAAFGVHFHDPLQKQELALAYLAVGLGFLCAGAGRYSLDHLCCRRCRKTTESSDPNGRVS